MALTSDDREAVLLDGAMLIAVQVANQRRRELARIRDGWTMRGTVAMSEDGTHLFFAEAREERSELRRLRLPKGGPETIIEQPGGIVGANPNPRRATVLWRSQSHELWVAGFDGTGRRRLETPAGRVLDAHWSPDGQSILYLIAPEDTRELHTIREQGLDTRQDSAVARTSQFAAFGRNPNATVFVGASMSKASPMVLVLLRSTRREFTLCEHRASNPDTVCPRFTPNSQRLIFESDRHGKRALYMLNVEKLIEKTDS
jgi:oligogalacturonide lyase